MKVLSHVRAYNVITLIDFCPTTLEGYYNRGLQEFANSRNPGPELFLEKMKKKALDSRNPINPEHVKKIQCNESQFSVLSENVIYFVDVLSACFGAKEKTQNSLFSTGTRSSSSCILSAFRLNAYDIPTLDSSIDGIAPSTSQSFTACPSSEYDIQPETNSNKEEQREKLIKAFRDTLEKFDPSGPAMEKAMMHLKKISSEGQCETMLATLGSNVSLKKSSGVAIRIQPTSIARTVGVTRGSKPLTCGRPSSGLQASKKRKHNLSVNIKMNEPNAKKH
ncbi:hypothetical protein AVEN_272703-1 [Araneus ventricosus]|uniref:Uncharacterized protein n=1 Tax=Araneus ventricosus TaxID=182803 RepID=A0A4Y2LAS2_ARAVE|nr:hypothetical protein AVEN_272703-1 [Araneus ventricosus]